jgi:hypothetical protein
MVTISEIKKIYRVRSFEEIVRLLEIHYSPNWKGSTEREVFVEKRVVNRPKSYPCLVMLVSTIDDEPMWGSGEGRKLVVIDAKDILDVPGRKEVDEDGK